MEESKCFRYRVNFLTVACLPFSSIIFIRLSSCPMHLVVMQRRKGKRGGRKGKVVMVVCICVEVRGAKRLD